MATALAIRPAKAQAKLTLSQFRSLSGRPVHHKKPQFTIPFAVVAGFLPAVNYARTWAPSLGWAGALSHTGQGLIGYDGIAKRWSFAQAKAAGSGAIIAGFSIHWAANKLGINRMLARMRVPIFRI